MARDQDWLCKSGDGAHDINWPARKLVSIPVEVSGAGRAMSRPTNSRHCERSEAIHSFLRPCCVMDCFAEPVIGRAFARPVGSQ